MLHSAEGRYAVFSGWHWRSFQTFPVWVSCWATAINLTINHLWKIKVKLWQ